MNENSKIVTWQLARGTTFDEIETLLYNLKERCENVTTVHIDDCCKLRKKIQSVFGTEVAVKLDLSHATQQITKTSTKCKLHFKCMKDLTLVFCDKRLRATPEPHHILAKLTTLCDKWKDIRDIYGVNVFTTDTLSEIAHLKRHTSCGCVSNIPLGGGTNRNEKFYHHFNSILHKNKISILKAYALLTVVIHAYNS